MKSSIVTALVVVAVAISGCKEEKTQQSSAAAPAAPGAPTAPAAPQPGGADHPNAVELGTTTAGGLTLKATQDEPIKPGGEGAFDLLITGGKPKAVRFWVGTEDAKGSVKAKADEESPDNWHTHAEVPDPLLPGSKFWAEIEPQKGAKFNVSFDLKQ